MMQSDLAWLALPKHRIVAIIYAAFALPFVLTLALEVPPFMPPDEPAHFERADQISRMELLSYRFAPDKTGGLIDSGFVEAFLRFRPILMDESTKVTRSDLTPVPWGFTGLLTFPNTALYPPLSYLPAAAAINVGKWIGLDILRTVYLARVALGLTSIGIATLAIALAGDAAIWLFTVLLLPSSALLMGAISQDGPMLAAGALAAALLVGLQTPGQGRSRPALILLGLIIAVMGMSRPPYAGLLLLLFATRSNTRATTYAVASTTAIAILGWWTWCGITTYVPVDPFHKADAPAQIRYLISHLSLLPSIISETMRLHFAIEYAGYFIAPLRLPTDYFTAAWNALALSGVAAVLTGARLQIRATSVIAASVLLAVTGLFLIQYMTWTPVGFGSIEGVLGRYFLPLTAILGGCLGPAAVRSAPLPWLHVPLLLFPAVSVILAMHAIVLRYYF